MKIYKISSRQNCIWVIEKWRDFGWKIYSIYWTRAAARSMFKNIYNDFNLPKYQSDFRLIQYTRNWNWTK